MEKSSGKKIIIVIGIAVVVVIVAGVILALVMARNNKLKATTMRLLRRVNVVTLEDANGKEKSMTDNMKLQNGNALKTEADSMVSVGLDEFKIVTVEEKSRAEFYQSGKQLELNLTEGSLFIDVAQHLADDESFDVRTATMTAGIRGTTVYVNQNPDKTWTMYLVSGALHVRGKNPTTKEEKEADIVGGQKVTAITYDDRETETIILRVEEFTEEEMPLQLINELVQNEGALERAGNETGFDPNLIMELAGIDGSSEGADQEQTENESEIETESSSEEAGDADDGDDDQDEDPNGEVEEVPVQEEVVDIDPEEEEAEELIEEESEESETVEETWLETQMDYVDEDGIWHLKDGTLFDPEFYRQMYGDELAKDGYVTDEDLLRHYLEHGETEKRFSTQESYDEFTEQYLAEKRAREEEERKAQEEQESGQDSNNQQSSSGTALSYDTASYTGVMWMSGSTAQRPEDYEEWTIASGAGAGQITAAYSGSTFASADSITLTLTDPDQQEQVQFSIPITEGRFDTLKNAASATNPEDKYFTYTDDTYGSFRVFNNG